MAWFYRNIDVINVWTGPQSQFAAFEKIVTPLWFWEIDQ